MDYGTLARLSDPGQAARGDRWGRIRRFQNLNNIQQQALHSSIPLAEMAAQRAQQEQTEYMAGAPGRMDQINLGNMTAAAGVKNFDRDQALKDLDAQLQDADKRAKLADVTQDIAGDADAYLTGDARLRNQIIQKNTGRKLRNGYVIGTDPNTDDMLFEIAGRARANAPALQNKLAVEDKKISGRLSLENIKSLSDKEKILLRGQIADDLQNKRFAFQSSQTAAKPMTESQGLKERLDQLYGSDTEGWLNAYRLIKETAPVLKVDEKEAMMRLFPQLADKVGPAVSPRTLPPSNNQSAPAIQTPAKTKSPDPKIGDVWGGKDKFGNPTKRKIVDVGRDPNGNVVAIKLEDGTIQEYK